MYHMRRHSRTARSVCGDARGVKVLVPSNFRMKLNFSPNFCCEKCKQICEKESPRR